MVDWYNGWLMQWLIQWLTYAMVDTMVGAMVDATVDAMVGQNGHQRVLWPTETSPTIVLFTFFFSVDLQQTYRPWHSLLFSMGQELNHCWVSFRKYPPGCYCTSVVPCMTVSTLTSCQHRMGVEIPGRSGYGVKMTEISPLVPISFIPKPGIHLLMQGVMLNWAFWLGYSV